MANKYLIIMQLMLLNLIGQDIIKCAATIQTEKIATEQDLELINATQLGKREIVEALIKQGADVNVVDEEGDTALICAAWQGHKEIVELLIKSKAVINAANVSAFTALMFAARYARKEIVELLIKAKANVNAANKYGSTALMYAARDGHKEIVELLLNAGANLKHKNKYRRNALELARENNNQEIAKMIEDEEIRRETLIKIFIENNQQWVKENFAKEITESTSGQIIPEISNIIAQYAMEYTDIPLEYRLSNKKCDGKMLCLE